MGCCRRRNELLISSFELFSDGPQVQHMEFGHGDYVVRTKLCWEKYLQWNGRQVVISLVYYVLCELGTWWCKEQCMGFIWWKEATTIVQRRVSPYLHEWTPNAHCQQAWPNRWLVWQLIPLLWMESAHWTTLYLFSHVTKTACSCNSLVLFLQSTLHNLPSSCSIIDM
jgi:hypothetical protein